MANFSHFKEAEQEANEIAEKYKDKQDVQKSMEQDFGANFSKIKKTHTTDHNFIAYATGSNIFFGNAVLLNPSLQNEVLAHELAHTMQQQAVPVAQDAKESVQQTVPEGVMQGFPDNNLEKLEMQLAGEYGEEEQKKALKMQEAFYKQSASLEARRARRGDRKRISIT